MPRSLDLARLQQFEPAPSPANHERQSSPAQAERWPSREVTRDGQISIKAPLDVIERFRRLCHDDRRTYADMLSILMESFEKQG